MTSQEFMKVLDNRLGRVRSTLEGKADEYARGDRLSNFKKIAAFRGKSPEDVLFSLVAKHIAALDDFIADIDKGKIQTLDRWDEKIGDIMSYMALLDALVRERLVK